MPTLSAHHGAPPLLRLLVLLAVSLEVLLAGWHCPVGQRMHYEVTHRRGRCLPWAEEITQVEIEHARCCKQVPSTSDPPQPNVSACMLQMISAHRFLKYNTGLRKK